MNLMTKSLRFTTALLILIAFPALSSLAQTPDAGNASLVDQITEQMAIKHQLEEAPEQIRVQFEQNPLQLSAKTNEQMLALFEEAYSSDLLLQDFKSALREEMNAQYKNEITEWLNNPDAQTVTEARQEYYTLQGKRKRIITMHEMEQEPPSSQRSEVISSLTDTTTIAESSVESSVIVLRSIIETLGALSPQQNFSQTQINTIANSFRTQMQAQAGESLTNQSMVMYYNVPVDVLEQYVAFWGTETGQWLDKAIGQSMQAAYQAAANRLVQSAKK